MQEPKDWIVDLRQLEPKRSIQATFWPWLIPWLGFLGWNWKRAYLKGYIRFWNPKRSSQKFRGKWIRRGQISHSWLRSGNGAFMGDPSIPFSITNLIQILSLFYCIIKKHWNHWRCNRHYLITKQGSPMSRSQQSVFIFLMQKYRISMGVTTAKFISMWTTWLGFKNVR